MSYYDLEKAVCVCGHTRENHFHGEDSHCCLRVCNCKDFLAEEFEDLDEKANEWKEQT